LFTLDTVDPTLDLSSPNGGETWYLGDTHDITWTAADTNLNPNSVYLWYSQNWGTDYNNLAEEIAKSCSNSWGGILKPLYINMAVLEAISSY